MTLCGNYDGPNRALPCHRELDDQGRHDGDHEPFPGNPRGLSWPNVDAGLRDAEEHANAASGSDE